MVGLALFLPPDGIPEGYKQGQPFCAVIDIGVTLFVFCSQCGAILL